MNCPTDCEHLAPTGCDTPHCTRGFTEADDEGCGYWVTMTTEDAFRLICEVAGQPWPNNRGRHYPYIDTEEEMVRVAAEHGIEAAAAVALDDIERDRALARHRSLYGGSSRRAKHRRCECGRYIS